MRGVSGDAVEVVLLHASAGGVEEAVLDLALKLQRVLEVGALRLLVSRSRRSRSCRARSHSGSRRAHVSQ